MQAAFENHCSDHQSNHTAYASPEEKRAIISTWTPILISLELYWHV